MQTDEQNAAAQQRRRAKKAADGYTKLQIYLDAATAARWTRLVEMNEIGMTRTEMIETLIGRSRTILDPPDTPRTPDTPDTPDTPRTPRTYDRAGKGTAQGRYRDKKARAGFVLLSVYIDADTSKKLAQLLKWNPGMTKAALVGRLIMQSRTIL